MGIKGGWTESGGKNEISYWDSSDLSWFEEVIGMDNRFGCGVW